MTIREYVEIVGMGAAAILAFLGFRKAMRESAGSSDENARLLRSDLNKLDKAFRTIRSKLRKLEAWIVTHMWDHHEERFDPDSVYDPTDPKGDSGGSER